MNEKFLKIKVNDFVNEVKSEFKKYKNIEKLKIVCEVANKDKKYRYFKCVNQQGEEVVKSSFVLDFGYERMKNGCFIPLNKKNVLAYQTPRNIEFSTSHGAICKLLAGDYIVIYGDNGSKIIEGMPKKEFEANFKSAYKASKIIKSYKETIDEDGLVR